MRCWAWWLWRLISDQTLNSQNTPHILYSRASSGMSIVSIFKKIHPVITEQVWGLLSQFPLFHYVLNFSALSIHMLAIEYHVHIWQVLPQLSCGAPVKYECDANNQRGTFAQSMNLNISKDCHLGYLNLKLYSPITFCYGHIFQWYRKNW